MLTPWKESFDQPRQHIKKQRHYFANKGQSSQGYGFSSSHVWMWELDYKESWAQKNWCFWTVVLEKTLWESLSTARRSNQSILKEISPGVFIGGTDVEAETLNLSTWCEELIHLKRPSCWERLKAGKKEADRGWDGWMTSPTQWTWICVDSVSWWWIGRRGVLRFMGSQRVGHDWAAELNWTGKCTPFSYYFLHIESVKLGDSECSLE